MSEAYFESIGASISTGVLEFLMDNDLKNPGDLAVVGAGAAGSAERDGAGCGARCEPDPSYGIQTWQKQRLCDRYFARVERGRTDRAAGPGRTVLRRLAEGGGEIDRKRNWSTSTRPSRSLKDANAPTHLHQSQ